MDYKKIRNVKKSFVIPGCFVEGEKCLSVCSSLEGKDENELKKKCEKLLDL